MQDPKKKQFIIDSIEKIRELKDEVARYRKENKDISDLMQEIQKVVAGIQEQADNFFESQEDALSSEELEVFLQSPSNFSEEDWELLQSIKKETAECKREIVKAGEGEAVRDIIGRNKKKKAKRGRPKRA